jgi:hypothetical protein
LGIRFRDFNWLGLKQRRLKDWRDDLDLPLAGAKGR